MHPIKQSPLPLLLFGALVLGGIAEAQTSKAVQVALDKFTDWQSGAGGQPLTSHVLNVDVGSPPKRFQLALDLGSEHIWLPHYSTLGLVGLGRLNYKKGYRAKESTTAKKDDRELTFETRACKLTGKSYDDSWALHNSSNSNQFRQSFMAISSASSDRFSGAAFDGLLGISAMRERHLTGGSMLANMKNAGLIDELEFSLALDPNLEPEKTNGGELTFGRPTTRRLNGQIKYHSVQTTAGSQWTLKLDYVALGGGIVSCYQANCTATLVTGTNDLFGPLEDIERLAEMFGAKKVNKMYEIDCLKVAQVEPLVFSIDNVNYKLPPLAFVRKKVEGKIFKQTSCYLSLMPNESDHGWILGTNFLSNFYAVFDIAGRRVGLALRA